MNDNERVARLVDQAIEMGGSNYSKTASMIQRNGKAISRQSFFKMVKGGSLRLSVFLDVLDALGIDLILKKK